MQLPLFPNRNVLTPRQLQVTACIARVDQQRNGAGT
jgi:hypothetical protein